LTGIFTLSPLVQELLSVDGCIRKIVLPDSRIRVQEIRSLQRLLSGKSIPAKPSLAFLCHVFGNSSLGPLFLSGTLTDTPIDLESADLSKISIETLNFLLSNENLTIESEAALLSQIMSLDQSYWPLLLHIRVEFLSVYGVRLLAEKSEYLSQPLWNNFSILVRHPPLPSWNGLRHW
jgi:hypothetical protein